MPIHKPARFFADGARPEDGIAKLKHLETTKGIWTMRCQLVIESRDLVILDKQTGVSTCVCVRVSDGEGCEKLKVKVIGRRVPECGGGREGL